MADILSSIFWFIVKIVCWLTLISGVIGFLAVIWALIKGKGNNGRLPWE